jgi:hypothetical protein
MHPFDTSQQSFYELIEILPLFATEILFLNQKLEIKKAVNIIYSTAACYTIFICVVARTCIK